MKGDEILIVIPARYASVRFPGKPLAIIGDKPMIQWVYENAVKTGNDVVVATDDDRILNCVVAFGGKAVLTSPHHESGTDRCLEAANRLEELEKQLPALRSAAETAEASERTIRDELTALQTSLVARERELSEAANEERQALRALDQAEAVRERHALRSKELSEAKAGLADDLSAATKELVAKVAEMLAAGK